MKHPEGIFKNHVCTAPFKDFMVLSDNTAVCCPEWFDLEELKKEYPEDMEWSKRENGQPLAASASRIQNPKDLLSNWNNHFHNSLRDSMINGDLRYCSTNCPLISDIHSGVAPEKVGFVPKEDLHLHGIDIEKPFPKKIYFNFDKACNLKCPSCRIDVIPNGATPYAQQKMDTIDEQFGSTVEHINVTGSGDPFYSNIFRKWLQNFDASKYPNLKDIYIVSNGNMFTPKMWKSIGGVHPYLQEMEWSIDAGTKYTYENRTRLNGRWDKLISNMKFLASLNHFKICMFSFVVQTSNYREMLTFVKLIKKIFNKSDTEAVIMFRRLQDWGHQHRHWVNGLSGCSGHDICNPNHIEHHLFLEEFEKVVSIPGVGSNLKHLLVK